MLMGSGPEGTFGSEISAPGDGWEEEGGRDYTAWCVLPLCLGKGYLLLITCRGGVQIP